MTQASAQGGVAVERGEIAEQLPGAGEQYGVSVDQRVMGDVARECRFADPVGTDHDDVGSVLEEVERHQGFEGRAVAAFRPCPIEVADGLEAADMSRAQSAFQAAAGALLLLPVDERLAPTGGGDLGPTRPEPKHL